MTEPTAPLALASSGQLDETGVRVGLNVKVTGLPQPADGSDTNNAGCGIIADAPSRCGCWASDWR